MNRCQGRPQGRPAGTGAKRRPLTTTATTSKHNENRPPARAGLTAIAPHEVRLIRTYSVASFGAPGGSSMNAERF
jgi:hypothetical protein